MDRLEVSPRSVRGYGNIVVPKLSTDFVGKYNEIYTDEDGYFVLSYGGVMLKASATVSNTIKGIQAFLTVLVSTRDSDTPVSGLSVDCSVDEVALTGQTTDSTGKCTFTWTPSDLGDSSLLITVTPQDDYAGLSLDKTVTVGLLLGFYEIMTSLSLEDDEVYTGTFEVQVEDRSQLSEFVKDVWVASGGEPIVDEYGIIHICDEGDLVVESEGLEQLPEYSNVLFEEDVDLLTGAVYDMGISEDYEIILDCLERDDIVPDVPPVPPSYDGVSLTSDKSILSYADSESATLSAQLTDDGSPASVSGVSVEFFKGSTSLGTATTNSSGVATKTYASAGSGDVSFTAEVDSIIVSETYSIEDCYKFDSLTSDKNLFSVTSGSATINYSNDGVTITGNTSTETHIVADFTLPESDYEITYDVNAITTASDGYTLHSCFEDLLLGHNRNGFYARKVSVSGDIWGGGGSYNPPCTMKLEVSGTTTKTIAVYRNNSQIKTTLTGINKTGVMQFISYANGRGLTLKNLKIKPL